MQEMWGLGFDRWVGKITQSRKWQPTPVFFPGNPMGRAACGLQSIRSVQSRSDQSLSHVRLFATLWIAAHQASLSITNSRSSPRLMSIESVMPSNHLILCRPLLLLPPIPPSIRVFSNGSVFIPIPKKENAKECSNYRTITVHRMAK